MTWYAKHSFENHIIYPDHYNDNDEGHRASYFYLHGSIEEKAGYDCFNCSPELMKKLLQQNIHLATVKIGEESYKCIVFCQFNKSYRRMKGYVVEIDSLEDVKDAIEEFPNAFSPCGGDTPDEYLRKEYKEIYDTLISHYNEHLSE